MMCLINGWKLKVCETPLLKYYISMDVKTREKTFPGYIGITFPSLRRDFNYGTSISTRGPYFVCLPESNGLSSLPETLAFNFLLNHQSLQRGTL